MGTAAIAAGGSVTRKKAAAVAALLKLAGITISESTLYEGARSAPGESPARKGRKLTLPPELLAAARKVAVTYRDLNVDVLKSMFKAEIAALIRGTALESVYPNGIITDGVYYRVLDNIDVYSNFSKPLEEDRALWRSSENAKRMYRVWAEVMVDACLAVWNEQFGPFGERYFDEASADDVLIFWLPGAENHVLSFDETDVCADETKRGKAAALRGVHVAAGAGTARRASAETATPGVGGSCRRKSVPRRLTAARAPRRRAAPSSHTLRQT